MAFTRAEHAVWWMVLGLGAGIGIGRIVAVVLTQGRWPFRSIRAVTNCRRSAP
jgi:hypothetical protein